MYTIILFGKYDQYFEDKKKIIRFATENLINNFKNKNIKIEIIICDINSKLKNLRDSEVFLYKKDYRIKIKFISITCHNEIFLYNIFQSLSYAFKIARYERIILKSLDTIFNIKIYDFLKKLNYRDKNIFFSSYRYDWNLKRILLKQIDFKNIYNKNFFFNKHKRSNNEEYFYYMNLHTNAAGDFILFNKNYFKNINFPIMIHGDSIFLYQLLLNQGKQMIIEEGKILKLSTESSFTKKEQKKELNLIQKMIDSYIFKRFSTKNINLIRGLFNYPKIIYNKINTKISLERIFLRILITSKSFGLIKNIYSKSKKNNFKINYIKYK